MSPESRQQVIALVLGLVFIVGFVLFAQRLGQFLRDRQQKKSEVSGVATSLSPTPVVAYPSPTPYTIAQAKPKQPLTLRQEPAKIPSTGPETILLGAFSSLLGGGYLLRRLSRKI